MIVQKWDHVRWICFALGVAALLVLFPPALRFTVAMFSDPHEDLSHGWLIPVVSGYVIWQARARLRAVAGAPAWGGGAALSGCLLLFWLGNRGEQARLMQFGMIGCVVALPWTYWGWRVGRALLFPAAYLLLMVPVSFLDLLTFKLRLLAAWVASGFLNGVGIAVHQVGTAMLSADGSGFKLDVADPCSGMRSVFALAALTAAYAYFTQRTRLRQWVLFLCAVPLAVIGNMVRIVTIGLVAHVAGQERAVGFYHDYSGYVVFVVAVLLMMQAGNWVARLGPEPAAHPAEAEPAAVPAAGWRRMGPCVLAPLLGICGFLALRASPSLQMEPDNFLAAEQPVQVGGYTGQVPWFCQNDQCLAGVNEGELAAGGASGAPACPRCGSALALQALGEKTWLPADTRIRKRNYSRGDGNTFAMTLVVSGKSRLSIHRPEMCLPGQGFQIRSSQERLVPLSGGRMLRVKFVQAARTGERPVGFVYWFVNGRGETASHWVRIFSDVWARCVHNRINRWGMVTLFSQQPLDEPEGWQGMERFLAVWYDRMLAREVAASP